MVLLMVFGFVAGAATAVSPCVLPVLPVALSAGATGGRRRPLGVVTGLVASFTFATVALVYVISALGLPDDLLRNLAIAVLAGFGLALLIPALGHRLKAWISRLVRRGPARAQGDGFGSGVAIGLSLGIVYAPCAGPILAGVITVSAAQPFTGGRLGVALAYAVGTAVVLYLLMIGGRRLSAKLVRHTARLQAAMGAVMVIVAMAMFAELDLRFQNEIADNLPAAIVNPSRSLEESDGTRSRLEDLRGDRGNAIPVAEAADRDGGMRLPVLARAPEIRGTQEWFNTSDGQPLTLAGLRGRVVLIDFWTYSCINCLRTLPYLRAWDDKYREAGLTIIGVHSPEFPFERDAGNVADAIRRNELRYAVAQDNDFATWNAYGNRFWPAKYLIDAQGRVRYTHFGEGEYDTTEDAIRSLLAEAGRDELGGRVRASTASPRRGSTPESYLGAARADRFLNGPLATGRYNFKLTEEEVEGLPADHLALRGPWRVSADYSAANGNGAALDLAFRARHVYLVLGSPGRPREVEVSLDGRPEKTIRVSEHKLYEIADAPDMERHLLTLRPEEGVEAYAFTFG